MIVWWTKCHTEDTELQEQHRLAMYWGEKELLTVAGGTFRKYSQQLYKAAGSCFLKYLQLVVVSGVAQRWSWRESVAFLFSWLAVAGASCVAKNDATEW